MPSERLTPVVEIERATPADILDGLETLEGRYGEGVLVNPPGEGPDRLLNWALQEVADARRTETALHCVNAVLHARRSLACLVDWYLQRDLATLCKDPPATPKQQVKFLIALGVIDELTSRVLERAIQKRNGVEHRFQSPTLDVAEDVVELLRRTIADLRKLSDPQHGPWVFGIFLCSRGFGPNGRYAEFHGWSDPLVVFSRFAPRPWVGIVLPRNKTSAVIRRALLNETTTEELLQLLSLAQQKFGGGLLSCSDAQSCETLASEAHLLGV